MAKNNSRTATRLIVTAIGIIVVIIALPQSWRSSLPSFLGSADFRFGLDLAGGTQLDFRISEDEIAAQLKQLDEEEANLQPGSGKRASEIGFERQVLEQQRDTLVEAIRTVLERRINSLGVSEASITPSYVGDEKHLLVECPGVVDVQRCIQTVGKTIQLEFKEEATVGSAEYEKAARARADAAYARIQKGETLQTIGQDLGDELGITYTEERQFFRDQLPDSLAEIFRRAPGDTVIRKEGTTTIAQQNEQGEQTARDIKGIFFAQVTQPASQGERTLNRADEAFPRLAELEGDLRYVSHKEETIDAEVPAPIAGAMQTMKAGELRAVPLADGSARIVFLRLFTPGTDEVEASHILVSYAGASQADASVQRTKEEALARAMELKKQLDGGANFADLARKESDGPSKQNGGSLGKFARGAMVPAFEQVAFSQPVGSISNPVETPFGYHIIRVDGAVTSTPAVASYDELVVPGPGGDVRGNQLIGKLQSGDVKTMEDVVTARVLFFSLEPTGWQDTDLDGKHFRTAAVATDPTTNFPVVQIQFDDEGGRLFQELTARNVQKRIAIFVGGELVSAPVVQQEISGGSAIISGSQNIEEARRLAMDLNTGAIPAPIHLVGQHTVEPSLGADAVRTSVIAGVVGIIIIMIYMIAAYGIFGVLANISLLVYAAVFLALMKLPLFFITDQYVVMTLAGVAGLILSMGMAVDANVLIYERIREERRRGKPVNTAIENGFVRAWPSIRDSNVSTLITCALLFIIGSSIVRGFAITLGLGVVVSMFSGITVNRWLCRKGLNLPVIGDWIRK